MTTNVEAWLRGPVPDVPPLLMPAAHALMHAEEDATRALEGLTTEQIWMKRSSAASIGYHLRHIAGSIDRLCTYARAGTLT